MSQNHTPSSLHHLPQAVMPSSQTQLPLPQQHFHHQITPEGVTGGSGNGGPGINNNVHLVYISNQQQHSGNVSDDSGICSPNTSVHNVPMPPASWVKPHHHHHTFRQQHQVPNSDNLANNNIECSSTQQQNDTYGAYSSQQQQMRNTFTKEELQQHCPYTNNNDGSSNTFRDTPNYNSSSSTMFYSSQNEHSRGDQNSSAYYHQQVNSQSQNHNFQPTFDCAKNNSNDEVSTSFYTGGIHGKNYFPQNSQHHYNSGNSLSQENYHQLQQHNKIINPQHPGDEYSISDNRINYNTNFTNSININPHQQIRVATYDQHQSSNSIHPEFHQQKQPFRRNSMESFSTTEPGDLAYNSKYTSYCSNNQFNLGNHAKRENNCWPTVNSSGEADNTARYFYNNHHNTSNQRQYPTNFDPSHQCGNPALPPGTTNFYQRQQIASCHSFEDQSSISASPSGLTVGCSMKAAPVKQRSLSLQYPRSEPTSSIKPNFEHHFHIPNINSSSNSDCASNSCRFNVKHNNVPVTSPSLLLDSRSSPMSHCSTGSSDNDSNNSYPECSTTTRSSDSSLSANSTEVGSEQPDCTIYPSQQYSAIEPSNFVAVDIKCEEANEVLIEPTSFSCSVTSKTTDSTNEVKMTTSSSSKTIKNRATELIPNNSATTTVHGKEKGQTSVESRKNNNNVSVTSTTKFAIKRKVKECLPVCEIEQSKQHKIECHDENDNCSTTKNEDHLNNNDTRPGNNTLGSSSNPDTQNVNLSMFENIINMNHLTAISCSTSDNENESRSKSLNRLKNFHHHPFYDQTTPMPQKIGKRSFSEADKDLVVNTTSHITTVGSTATLEKMNKMTIPEGWKRETTITSNPAILYISPSGTKLRTWDELKQYVSSDGTCKCGLDCPLRLERVFSFDPTVITSYKNDLDDELLNTDDSKSNLDVDTRFCCNRKRKFSRIEDSPLISSTRDDLGDNGEHQDENESDKPKKRRTENVDVKNEGLPTLITIPEAPLLKIQAHNVPLPFSQQSPDTTTLTPQRDMSPASSVSSELSTSILSSGNRSANSTPTPTSSKLSPNIRDTTTPNKWQGQYDFAWPTPQISTNSPTLPTQLWTSTSNAGLALKDSTSKKCKLLPKISCIKRSESPCPNIDVRQIPLERNRPPPRPRSATDAQQPKSSKTPVDTSQNQNNSNVSLPISRGIATLESNQFNTGYSLFPTNSNITSNALQLANILPMQFPFQRIVTSQPSNENLFIQQSLSNSLATSVIDQSKPLISSSLLRPSTDSSLITLSDSSGPVSNEKSKSPLECVQDVVDRFHAKLTGKSTTNSNGANCSSSSKKYISDTVTPLPSKVDKEPQNGQGTSQHGTSGSVNEQTSLSDNLKITLMPNNNDMKNTSVESTTVTLLDPSINIITSQPISSSILISTPVPQTNLSNASVTTSSASNIPIMTTAPLLNCSTSTNSLTINSLQNNGLTVTGNNGNQLFLQHNQANGTSLLSANASQQMRYPFFQTIQPIFLNSGGGQGSLIISPQSQLTSHPTDQSFIQFDQNTGAMSAATAEMLQQTMVIDPSMCGNANMLGAKKKKKRLSKKQQQQQAQLQLQQQLLLQQIQQQVQAQQQQVQVAAQQNIPQLIFPQSFQLGAPGFSLQPMNFFQTPTYLTMPNLILNPDGTLFLQQPSGSSIATVPATNTSTVKFSGQYPIQTSPVLSQPGVISPKKDGTLTPDLLKTGSNELSFSSDDSRQNATPDSSTNDLQLGFIGASTAPTSITVSLPLGTNTNLASKKSNKSKTVSSSSNTQKRILPQKQILPKIVESKIDSTTPSTENN